jgi:transposase InsO family protein
VLTVKKILAGRGAVDYYLDQTRRGLADYYLPENLNDEADEAARLPAPSSSWWGSGAEAGGRGSRRNAACTDARLSPRRSTVTTTLAQLPAPPDLVACEFTATEPNRLWVGDLSFVRTWQGWLYVGVLVDVFLHRVVGWGMEPLAVLAGLDVAERTDVLIQNRQHQAEPLDR